MKKIRKTLSVIISAVLIMCALCPAAGAVSDETLRFGEDGKFRIMHITDTHFTDCPFSESVAFIEKALDEYEPDLVVFGGDNIKGWYDTSVQLGVKAAIDALVAPLEERNIPFTYTYGNHDWEAYLCPKLLQNGMYDAHSNCIKPEKNGLAVREGDGYVQVKDSSGKKNILNLWLLDSGTIIKTGEKYVESVDALQLEWYKNTNAELRELNGGTPIRSLVFQHFPVWEVTEIFDEVEDGVSCGDKEYKLKDGFTDGVTAGRFGIPNDRIKTHLNKSVEIPTENSGEYDAWVSQGDVIGAFFGHAHVNDYCGITDDGIILGSTMSAGGFNISSRFDDENGEPVEARGLRVIELDENALLDEEAVSAAALTTFSVYYTDYFDGSIEKYPSKYKALDEHNFGEWLLLQIKYLIDLIIDVLFVR